MSAGSFQEAELLFTEYETSRGLARDTKVRKTTELRRFFGYLAERGLSDIREVRGEHIESYFIQLKESGYTTSTVRTAHAMLVDLFNALFRSQQILTNPLEVVEIALSEPGGLKPAFTQEEMRRLLEAISTHTGFGMRDRAMFELLYVTGMRLGELDKA